MTTPTEQAIGVSVTSHNGSGPPAARRTGLPARPWDPAPPGVPATRSTYLNYLPGLYQESDFLGRFLLIFEHILSPVDRTIGNVSHYLNPDLTPSQRTVAQIEGWILGVG